PDLRHLQPVEEVWADPPAGVEVWNAYFECTPLDLFSGVIVEGRVLGAREVTEALTAMPVAAALSPTAHRRQVKAPSPSGRGRG
ncbi:MAG: hypothetical protein HYZ81_23965, partial [Nitrospinae bacterium]|nr:hypothetical protein [Nitrospinota bacterium]